MKKITLSLLGLAMCATSYGQADQNQLPAQKKQYELETVQFQAPRTHQSSGTEAVYWSEDFANGIPATWTNQGFDGGLQPMAAAQWEYRGPGTTPGVGTGSRGAFAAANDPIQSATRTNGFVIFDSGWLDNNGSSATVGQGVAPAPHVGTLTTDTIDLTGHQYIMLELNSYARVFFANMQIAMSPDGGVTWPDTITAYSDATLGVNGASPNVDNLQYNISAELGNSANAMIRFIFDGRPGNANGNGYYFWCLDDISILDLPNHSVRFVENTDGAPAHDIIYNNDGLSSKHGIMPLKQNRPISFDANIYNFGSQPQTNLRLQIDILDDNDNVVQTLSSQSVTLQPDSIADYNVMNTAAWTATTTGNYRVVYSALSDSVTGADIPRDTFQIFVTDSLMSTDFNTFDNRFGTDDIGPDGSAIASRFDLVQGERIFGADIWLSNTTVAGGVVEVTIMDTTGFTFTNGFPGQPLAYVQHTVTAQDVANRVIRVQLRDASGLPITLDATNTGAYYVVVTMFSNADANPINLRNSTHFSQPSRSSIMYYTISAPRWYTGFEGSLDLNAPHIRVITCALSDPAGCAVSVEEIDLSNEIKLYPNPADEYVNMEFGDVSGEFDLRIVDMQGRTITTKSELAVPGTSVPVDVSMLTPGVYILSVEKDDSVSSFRLTVE
ncbi:T9SS type A sorting domain-containing protein [Phaeocystidibacter luteus]|uniref:T9SS type A sorting domain-containing protein n=1 Tax=Phaeocystidibacter luteus TaxID=911197 RepID=A0A6N6RKK5_9FLAO|nr:T9SS type A sorting domain-containing protein [Phaeocystidibacter luteus]KAB2810310.1 T9SS type A sorting domain-containing protein [Phaeocystidibacter luteus]